MSGYQEHQFNFPGQTPTLNQSETQRNGLGEHEQVWTLTDNTMNGGNQQGGYQDSQPSYGSGHPQNHHMGSEEPPPGLMQSNRTDSINSTTVFVNPNDIQPRNSHRYSGASLADQIPVSAEQMIFQQQHVVPHTQQTTSGVKRRHSESESQQHEAKVIVVASDGTIQNMTEDFLFTEEIDIPLGGSAIDNQGTKIEMNQDSNHSWSSSIPEHQLSGSHPSPTGADPSTVNYLGHYLFDVMFTKLTQGSKNKHWDFSSQLKKLYIDMNKWVQVEFRVGPSPPDGLFIRALPIYAEATHIRDPVKRCPNHASNSDPTNQNCDYPYHLIRFDSETSNYGEDTESGRLSVVFPVQTPHQGTDKTSKLMKFMCLGSDVGGINRRPLKVIFTLEEGLGRVVGRKVVDVRICSCPKRDKQQEEARLEVQEGQARRIAERFASSTVVVPNNQMMPPPGKKLLEKEPIIMVPVHADDFKKLNEFAEAAWVMREVTKDPRNADSIKDSIKETRRRLLHKHNSQLLKTLEKNKKPS
eukprot:GFUD01015311.1.p1 GENE.GFUD01015311.1~~GFUD01015311.1.p1  ORF type:complete len:525 (+),score=111.78 GFUD01015311.1:61-1635(+)